MANFPIVGELSKGRFVILIAALLVMAWILWTIFRFATADGDLIILRKSAPPSGAFKDKVVWITGASQGLGEELAQEYARLGAKLILSSRRISELERVKSTLSGDYAPGEVVVLPLDVSAGEAVIKEAVDKAESAFNGSGVDIMVHNAAGPRLIMGALEFPEDETKTSFAVNVLGTIGLTRLLAPKMVSRGHGHFVVLSSAGGKVPAPGQAVYCSTKFAIMGYFGALRSEMSIKGIKVTLVCPGPIATDPAAKDFQSRQPLGRVVDLTMKAAYHHLEEVWIMMHPILLTCYLQQYFPTIASKVLQKIGQKRVQQGNTYSLRKLLKKE